MFVTKADGRREEFNKNKIIRTCLRMRASEDVAREVADKIERRAYNGISTRKILYMIFDFLKDYRPVYGYHICLREAISLLRPKPDFEEFIRIVLRNEGYEVEGNKIVAGKCVEHEIDGIAKINGETIMVEVKHHVNHHVYVGLETCLEYYAAMLDIKEGGELNFNKLMIACNTKFSEHAIKFANCRKIMLLGWKYPKNRGLEDIIEEFKLYPITYLADLKREDYEKLGDRKIITLKQLVAADTIELKKSTGIKLKILEDLKRKAEAVLEL